MDDVEFTLLVWCLNDWKAQAFDEWFAVGRFKHAIEYVSLLKVTVCMKLVGIHFKLKEVNRILELDSISEFASWLPSFVGFGHWVVCCPSMSLDDPVGFIAGGRNVLMLIQIRDKIIEEQLNSRFECNTRKYY